MPTTEEDIRLQLEKQAIELSQLKSQLEAEAAAHEETQTKLKQSRRQLILLNQVEQTFSATHDLDQVLLTVLKKIRNLMGVSACSIWLVDSDTGELICRQATGAKSNLIRGWRLAPGEGVVGWVARYGKSVIVPDTKKDPRHFEEVNRQLQMSIRSILGVPFKVKQRVIGAFEVVDTAINRFDKQHLAQLEPLTASVTIFIENAQLYERAQKSRERFRQFVTSISDHIYVTEVTADGQRLNRYISPNVEALTGYSWQTFKKDWRIWLSKVIHPEDRDFAAKQAKKLFQGEDSDVEYRLIRADGKIIWVRDSGRVEREGTSKIIYGVVGEITERKRHEKELETIVTIATALRTAATRTQILSTILNHGLELLDMEGTAIGIYDPYINQKIEIELAGGVWANLTGAYIAPHDQENKYIFVTDQLYVNNDVQNDPHLIWAKLLGNLKAIAMVPLVAQAKSIGVLWVGRKSEISADLIPLLITIGNMAAHAIHEATLVEELRRSNEELAQERASLAERVEERTAELSLVNAELAQASRLKDEFLANMSHELRTPLTAVLSMSELLRTNTYGPLNEKQRQALYHVEEGGRHLLDLINDILDLSKIEAGKLTLRQNLVFVENVCEISLRFIKQVAREKHIDISFELDDSVETIYADERRLKQILVNLLTNAVKFTPEGGQVGLRIESDAAQEIVRFIIWDTGIGITKADMGRLFQPFVQIDSSLSRQYEGTGLGLSLAARLTEMHQGSIAIASEEDKGTQLTVSLPWSGDEDQAEKLEEQPLPSVSRRRRYTWPYPQIKTILLVEDNETIITTLRDFLQENKEYQVILARDGAEAVTRAVEAQPDLILMDIQLPVMNGLEAIRQIRAKAETKLAAIPIIALTALAMPGDQEQCLAAGADEYISKPVSLRRLDEIIKQQWIDTSEYYGRT